MISPAGGNYGQAYNRSHLPQAKQEEVEVNVPYKPAELDIKTRNPEMSADWDRVREELGYLGPTARMNELSRMADRQVAEAIAETVQAGILIRNIHKEKGNVFGKIAFERFTADRIKEVRLDSAPKFGLKIDVRIYPPEITVDTNVKGGTIYF